MCCFSSKCYCWTIIKYNIHQRLLKSLFYDVLGAKRMITDWLQGLQFWKKYSNENMYFFFSRLRLLMSVHDWIRWLVMHCCCSTKVLTNCLNMRPSPPTYTIPWARGMCLHPYGRESNGAMSIPWMYCLTLIGLNSTRNVLFFFWLPEASFLPEVYHSSKLIEYPGVSCNGFKNIFFNSRLNYCALNAKVFFLNCSCSNQY